MPCSRRAATGGAVFALLLCAGTSHGLRHSVFIHADHRTWPTQAAPPHHHHFPSFRDARRALASFQDTDIAFGPGIHDLVASGGIHLTEADRGATLTGAGMNLTYLSGGLRLDQWQATTAHGLPALVHSLPANTSYFRQLFVATTAGFARRITARTPEMSYNHTNMNDPQHSIVYQEGQVLPQYHNQQDVLATLYHCWTATTHRIRSITPENLTLTLYQAPHVDIPRCEHASGKRFYLEDAWEYLDTPGEFYVDRQANTVTYLPLPGEAAASLVAYAPQLITLLSATNTSQITASSLALVHGAADMSGFFEGDCDAQSAANLLSAAVSLNHAAAITLTNLSVAHTGSEGIWANVSAVDILLARLVVFDVGASAVRVGTASTAPLPNPTRNVTLVDSYLSDGGHIYMMGPGILLVACEACTVAHNSIHDFFYTGVSTGYAFDNAPVDIQGTRLAFNLLYNLGRGRLSDMGCVYTWGGYQPDVVVDSNICHSVENYPGGYGGYGFYTDQTSNGIHFTNNLVYNTSAACYHDHDGNNVSLVNNIFVYSVPSSSDEGAIRSANPTSEPGWFAQFNFTRNIVSVAQDALVFTDDQHTSTFTLARFDHNLYWKQGAAIVFPGNQSFSAWQAHGAGALGGQDLHSLVADPHFVDPSSNNYELLPSSPAFALGFQALNLSQVGPRW